MFNLTIFSTIEFFKGRKNPCNIELQCKNLSEFDTETDSWQVM